MWSSTLIQEIRTGQSYYRNIAITDANGMNLADQIGIPGANLTMFTSGAPTINIPAYHAFLIGTQNSLPWDRAKRTTNLATNVTKIWGNHTLKVGAEFRNTNDFLDQVTHPRGEFTFTGAMTAIPTDSAAQNGYANQMAAFLLDVPQEIERGIPAVTDVGLSMDEPHRGGRHKSFWTYVHDKWQVHPSITLDLGLRHEYYTPLVGFHGKGGMVNYDPETNQLLVAGYGNIPENLGVPSYWKNFAPRTGISWRLTDATVLRAGYGVSGLAYPDGCCRGFPIEQNQLINGPNSLRGGGLHGHGHSGPLPRADSGERHTAWPTARCSRRNSPTLRSNRVTGGSCTRGTWPTSGPCPEPSRPKWPTSVTAQATLGTTRISMRAWSSARIAPASLCSTSSAEPGLLR